MISVSDRHFTYNENLDETHLKQGDILRKSEALSSLLAKYHHYYAATQEYSHFQVLTQSCDLVRRGKHNQCTSRYITLAAVRNLDVVIKRIIDTFADKKIEIESDVYCSDKHKDILRSRLEKLFNNNDKEVFFLKAAPDAGLLDDSCTFLHLSVAIRAYEHYDLCLDAKILELKDNFRAKLGWMVGNLYSRVGTEDYVPAGLPDAAAFEAHIERILERYVAWVPQDAFPDFRKVAKSGLSFEQILQEAKVKLEKRKLQRAQSLASLITQECNLDKEQNKKVLSFLCSQRATSYIK